MHSKDDTPSLQRSGFAAAAAHWQWLLLPAIIAGTWLRLWSISGQVLLDDEWHSLNFVLDKSFLAVLTGGGLGANCIPLNCYAWLLLHTAGWSEPLLRAPSLICGIAALAVLPLLVARLWGRLTGTVFAYLLAAAPCVIFYSRVFRPYSIVLFSGFTALLSFFLWSREGKRSWMALYVLSGFTAIFHHLYASIPVLTPLLVAFSVRVAGLMPGKIFTRLARLPVPELGRIVYAGLAIALLCVVLIFPAYLSNPWWRSVFGRSSPPDLHTLWGYLSLLSGTHWALLKVLFLALAGCGAVFLVRKDTVSGGSILCCEILYFVYLYVSRQDDINSPILVARFGIILFPVALLLVSTAVASFAEATRVRRFGKAPFAALALAGLATIAAASPLPHIYRQPNNFTNQSAYQYSYEPTDWSLSRERDLVKGFRMKKSDIPRLYFSLAGRTDVPGIVEFPMLIGDHFNQYYYYQLFHRKRVAAGYIPEIKFPPLASKDEFVYGDTPVDYVMSRVPPALRARVRFRNLVSLTDAESLGRRCRDWLLIVHKDPFFEMFPALFARQPNGSPSSGLLIQFLKSRYAQPDTETDQLAVWRIR